MTRDTRLLQLEHIVGTDSLLVDDSSKTLYGKDLTQPYTPTPLAIVFPQDETQVTALVQWANTTKTSLVPSGGRTGYSGGAVARDNEVVVSLGKMNRIYDFNPVDQMVKCQPGVITKDLQDFALQQHLYYPVDFASSGSSHIGGNIATNAGGIKVIRYGLTREWISGLRVVTGNGDLLDLNHGLIKNASGYDLRHLWIGSEGTLGIVTEATIRLTTPPLETQVALLSVSDASAMMDILVQLRKQLSITAFEFFSDVALQYVLAASASISPFAKSAPFYVLVEYEKNNHSDTDMMNAYDSLYAAKHINDGIVSSSEQQKYDLWHLREAISMSLQPHCPYKYDISVLPSLMTAFMQSVNEVFHQYPAFEVVWFGHVGDGNLHLNILKPSHFDKADFFDRCEKMSHQVYACVKQYHGSVSAEHGIGLIKKDFLPYSKSEAEIAYMRSIKKIFDKNNIMNPGKIF